MFTSSLLLYVLLASQASVGTKDLEVKVVRVGIPTPAKDKLRLNVDIQLLPAKPLTLNRIVIHHLKANGIPIFTSPINEKLQMSSGLPVARSIPVWVNYRDLQSLEPMISAVDTNSMVVEGEVSLDVDVGLLASVVLLHRNVPARTKFRSTVPVDVPGGTIGKRALLAALRGTDRVRDLMSSRFSTKNRDWLNSLQAEYQDSWVLVGTVYQLKGKKGETQKFSVIRCGGFLNERQMLVTHESLEPWLYDPEAALLLASRKWKVDESSTDIWVWRTGERISDDGTGALSLKRGELRFGAIAKAKNTKVFTSDEKGSVKRVTLSDPDASDNVALLELSNPAAPKVWKQSTSGEKSLRLVVFRFPEGWAGEQVNPELVPVNARRESNRWIFDEPIDASAIGSFLISDDGLVGRVSSESGGWALEELLPLVGLQSGATRK